MEGDDCSEVMAVVLLGNVESSFEEGFFDLIGGRMGVSSSLAITMTSISIVVISLLVFFLDCCFFLSLHRSSVVVGNFSTFLLSHDVRFLMF